MKKILSVSKKYVNSLKQEIWEFAIGILNYRQHDKVHNK
jgi:hypothetical protein